jgi:uncharacterized protein YndB with AHSA1/START domain
MTSLSTPTLTVSLPSDREVVLIREFDAPRDLVFEAFSKPEHIAHWWGQKGSTMPICEMDFRPGGAWRFVERAADGKEYGFHGEYREITRPERIAWTFEFEGLPGHVSVETMVFEDLVQDQSQNRRTRITATAVFDSVEDRDGMVQSGMAQGASESYERLAEYLQTLA